MQRKLDVKYSKNYKPLQLLSTVCCSNCQWSTKKYTLPGALNWLTWPPLLLSSITSIPYFRTSNTKGIEDPSFIAWDTCAQSKGFAKTKRAKFMSIVPFSILLKNVIDCWGEFIFAEGKWRHRQLVPLHFPLPCFPPRQIQYHCKYGIVVSFQEMDTDEWTHRPRSSVPACITIARSAMSLL